MEDSKLCVVYKLHKDKSTVVQGCDSVEEQNKHITHLEADGYKPIAMTMEKGMEILNKESEKYKPKPLTSEESWWKWAVGH
mgnify:CR=1|tara:strand:- start:288 stop:530 length:243 start_codon:yes stop_codon:yes gene_type:complete